MAEGGASYFRWGDDEAELPEEARCGPRFKNQEQSQCVSSRDISASAEALRLKHLHKKLAIGSIPL